MLLLRSGSRYRTLSVPYFRSGVLSDLVLSSWIAMLVGRAALLQTTSLRICPFNVGRNCRNLTRATFRCEAFILRVHARGSAQLFNCRHYFGFPTFRHIDLASEIFDCIVWYGNVASWDSSAALEYRLRKADAHAWTDIRSYSAKSSKHARVLAWCESSRSSATYKLHFCHWSSELLQRAKTWEMSWMRRLLRLRRHGDETFKDFLKRTTKLIMSLYTAVGKPLIHEVLLAQTLRYFARSSSLFKQVVMHRTGTWRLLVSRQQHIAKRRWGWPQSHRGRRTEY